MPIARSLPLCDHFRDATIGQPQQGGDKLALSLRQALANRSGSSVADFEFRPVVCETESMSAIAQRIYPDTEAQPVQIEVRLAGREELHLHFDLVGNEVKNARLTGVGCPALLALLAVWRPRLKGPLDALPLPDGQDHSSILLRELILRAQGKWDYPYKSEEICHCRAVTTAKVDAAIVTGAHTISAVSRRTSAGTSCGTCQPDVQDCIKYRLGRK